MQTMEDAETLTTPPPDTFFFYVAMSRCTQQMIWMHSWLDEVEIHHSCLGIIKGNNCGAIALTKNTKDHGKIKHIVIYHFR